MQRLNKELTVLAVIIVVTALAIAQAHRQYGKTINEKGKARAYIIVLPLPLPYSVFFAEGNCTR
jgi:hypothetical protein